jgi:hypothetical protein
MTEHRIPTSLVTSKQAAEGVDATSGRSPRAPVKVSSGCWLLWFRADLDPAVADAYWEGGHGDIVAAGPGKREYRQHHFSRDDHGFWPAPAGIGTRIPADWRLDGMPEVALGNVLPSFALVTATAKIFVDEQNAFERMLAQFTGPRGGRWFTGPHQDEVGVRMVVLIRRRRGVRLGKFRHFVHEVLAPALLTAGAQEVRSHVFLPGSHLLWMTPGLAHDNPPHRRYSAAIVIGAADRADLMRILHSPRVASTQDAQARHCVALHAYAVDRTVPRVIEHQLVTTSNP